MPRLGTVTLLILAIVLPATSDAFDGQRKGFVMGAGGGYSPHLRWTRDGDNLSEINHGPNLQFVIGYAFNDNNMLTYNASPGFAHSGELKQDILQGVWSIRWSAFFGGRKNDFGVPDSRWYSSVGAGRAAFSARRNYVSSVTALGWGIAFGVGHEVHRHLMIEATYSLGWGSDDGYDYNHQNVHIALIALAY